MDIINLISQEQSIKEEKKQEKTLFVLSREQEIAILEFWNSQKEPPSLKEILGHIFPGKTDTRCSEGWAIRRFLSTRNLVWKKWEEVSKLPPPVVELTPEQQEYIINNCNTMKAHEMAREIFKNPQIVHTSRECDVIRGFLRHLSANVKNASDETLLPDKVENFKITPYDDWERDGKYTPPKSILQAARKVNKYTNLGLEVEKLTAQQKKELTSLINYLHSPRFIAKFCDYITDTDRELFESTFIRCTYDKEDLTSEEIDQYIMYSVDVVLGQSILTNISTFQEKMNESLHNEGKIHQPLVDAIGVLRDDHDKCVKRQNDVLKRLTGTRNERKANFIKENQSLVQIVEAFKLEETRKRWAKHGQLRKEALKNEVQRLDTLDALIAECFGVDQSELINS